MRKTETTEIDGLTFSVTQLPYRRGRSFAYKAAGYFLPALSKVHVAADALQGAEGLLSGGLDGGAEALFPLLGPLMKGAGDALETLFARMSPTDLDQLEKEMFEFTIVTTPEGYSGPLAPVADEVLAGKVGTGAKLLFFAVKLNCADFMPALGAKAGALAAMGSRYLSTSKKAGTPGE